MCLAFLFNMGKKKKNFGFKKSIIDGTEHIFGVSMNEALPKEYSYRKYLPDVLNQGDNPICVPCSLSAYINWNKNLSDGQIIIDQVTWQQILQKLKSQIYHEIETSLSSEKLI